MSEDDLLARIADASGRVFIGFKSPDAGAGVDEHGRLLADARSIGLAREALAAASVDVRWAAPDMPAVVARIPQQAVRGLLHNPLIEYIEPIFPLRWASQDTTWNVRRINAVGAWPTSDGTGTILQIIDSGLDPSQTQLSPAVQQTCDAFSGQNYDIFGHGTTVAGIAAAINDGSAIIGASPGVTLWSSKVGNGAPDPDCMAEAISFGRIYGVRVMNISIGIPGQFVYSGQ
jgi:subtilisin family serine protease